MKGKRLLFTIGLLFIISVCFFSLYWYFHLREIKPEGKITAFFHLYSSPIDEQLEKVLKAFSKEYPAIELDYYIEPYLDMKRAKKDFLSSHQLSEDHIVVSTSTVSDVPVNFELSPGMWNGTEWRLFYNSRVLANFDISEKDLMELSSSGFMKFIEYFSPLAESNQNIFAVSSKYYIQYLAWLQHLELEQNSGRMPENFSPENWVKTIDTFNNLVSSGFINSDHREVNEASTAIDMFKGKALFCLYTDEIYSIFLPGDRNIIKSIPFPGSEAQGWIVGSGFYLTFTKPEEVTAAANKAGEVFINFLRSEEVIEQMLKTAGVKLNPPRSRKMTKEIPSISSRVRDKELRPLIKSLQ